MGRTAKTRLGSKAKGARGDPEVNKLARSDGKAHKSKRRGGKKATKKGSVTSSNTSSSSSTKKKMDSDYSETRRTKSTRTIRPATNLALINGESKNESFNLRNDIIVKRRGGLMLSWTGARVEIPSGALGGTKARLISAPLPAPIRAYACPWLGPNLRLGSEVHLVWSSAKLRKPVQIFIPFSYAAVMELTTPEATQKVQDAYAEKVKAVCEAAKVGEKGTLETILQGAPGEGRKADASHPKKEQKKAGRHERNKPVDYVTVDIPILDTRSVFVLQSKIGDDFWTVKKDVEIIQPSIHHLEWPNRLRDTAYQAGRFSENTLFKSGQNGSDHPSSASPTTSAANKRLIVYDRGRSERRLGASLTGTNPPPSNDVENMMRAARDGVTPLEVAKRAAAFTGGVTFSLDGLNNFVVVVIGTPSETVAFDTEGGLLRSPIIHPFFSVRVPKLALRGTLTSTFKAVQVRKDLIETIQHFDNQLTEINECSNIYELDLGDKPFERPVTITLPLPEWYIQMIERLQAPPQLKNSEMLDTKEGGSSGSIEFMLDMGNGNVRKSRVQGPTKSGESAKGRKRSTQANMNNEIPFEERPKNLILVYQRPFIKRQLVWRSCNGDINSDNTTSRKRQTKVDVYRDTVVTPMLRGDNLNAKNGWIHLLLGLKGGPWKDVPINGPFSPRCLQINTYQLGRFAMVYSNEPARTPSSKIAHLMSRLEALSVAPPGVLLPCLRVDPTRIQLSVDCVPVTKLISTLEERLTAGFIPLVQSSASPSRRCAAVANCAYQSLNHLLAEIQTNKTPIPVFGTSRYRISGYDLLRVLLYNGLCIRVVVKGYVQIKTRGIFDCLTSLLSSRKSTITQQEEGFESSSNADAETAVLTAESSAALVGIATKTEATEQQDVLGPEQFITSEETRFCFHELLSDTATVIDLEPLKESFARGAIRRSRKENLTRNLMIRRLKELEAAEALGAVEQEQVLAEDNMSERVNQNIHNASNGEKNSETTPFSTVHHSEMAGEESDKEDRQETEEPVAAATLSTQKHNVEGTVDLNEDDEGQNWIPSGGADGDDEKTTIDTFQDLSEAFSKKDSSFLGAQTTRDLCRRLTTIYDSAITGDAIELIDYVHEMYTVGKLEIYLVQPGEMSQVREAPSEDDEVERRANNVNNAHASKVTPLGNEDNVNNEETHKPAVLAHGNEDGKTDTELSGGEFGDVNQSNMKWHKKMDIIDPRLGGQQTLASYDVRCSGDRISSV
ncbi:hypothetical protein Aperf_G00000063760 [Anoplocephala perfoliata]